MVNPLFSLVALTQDSLKVTASINLREEVQGNLRVVDLDSLKEEALCILKGVAPSTLLEGTLDIPKELN